MDAAQKERSQYAPTCNEVTEDRQHLSKNGIEKALPYIILVRGCVFSLVPRG
jgi:hypothetical protein